MICRRPAPALVVLLLLFGGVIGLQAQTVTWTGLSPSGDGNDIPYNWLGNTLPLNNGTEEYIFGPAARYTVTFYNNVDARKVSIVGNNRPYELDNDYGNLTIRAGGLVYAPAAPVSSILGSYNVILAADQTWDIQSGELGFYYDLTGTGRLTKTGAGTLHMTYANWWTGGITLNAGQLVLDNDVGYWNLGSGSFIIGPPPGGLTPPPTIVTRDIYGYGYDTYVNNAVELNGILATQNEVPLNLEGAVTLNTDTTIKSQGAWLVINGAVADGPTATPAARKLTVDSKTAVILAGTNTYTGGTHVENGALIFATVGSLPAVPVTNSLTSSANGYIGFGDDGTTNAGASLTNPQGLFLDRFNKASTFGTIGFDTDPDLVTTNNYSGNIDLSAAPTGTSFAPSVRLGSATHAILSGTITPQGTAYRFGGGGGVLEVSSPLTDQTTPTAAARSLVVDSPTAFPLTLRVANAVNNYTGGTSVTNSALIFSTGVTNGVPGGIRNITINSGGYVGFVAMDDMGDDLFVQQSLEKIITTSVGTVGYDNNLLLTVPINLGSFTNALYLGTATPASGVTPGLTLSGTITTTNTGADPYRFASYKGGALEVSSTLTGANGVLIGDPNSPGTFGDYHKEEYSTVALSGNNSGLTGHVTLYGGKLLVGQHYTDGVVGTDPTHALGSGTLVVQGMTLPTEWQDDGESPAPALGTTTAGVIIPNNVTLNTDLNIAEFSQFTLAGKISGPGELYLEGGDYSTRTTLTLTNDLNDFTGGIYLGGYSRLDVGSDHATSTGPLGFGFSSSAEVYFHTTAPVIGGLMSKESGDSATLYAEQTGTVLKINQTFDSQFNGYFRSTKTNYPLPDDNFRIVKDGVGMLRLNNGGLNFYHGTAEATLNGNPEVSLQVNPGGALVLGNSFYTGELSATTTWIHGGTLTLDGATLGTSVVIDNSGQLTGSGTVTGAVSLSSNQSFGQTGVASSLRFNGGLDATNAGTTVTVAGGALRLGGTTGPNIGTIAVGTNSAVVFDATGSLPATAITATTGSYVGLGYAYLLGASFGDLVGKLTPTAFAGTLGLDNSDGGGSYSNTGNLNLAAFTHLDFAGLGSISDGLIESAATITGPASGTLQLSGIDGGKLQVDAALLAANGVTKVTIGRTDGHGDAGVVTLNNTGNTYTGGTDVLSGTLMIGESSDGAPGFFTATPYGSGAITLHGGTALRTLDLDWDFTVTNAINLPGEGAKPVTIHLGGDYLYLTGLLTGPGALSLRNYSYGELHLTGDNSGWSGGLKVNDDATVFVDSPTALGTGILSFNPALLGYYIYPEVSFTTPTAAIGGLSGGFNDNSDGYYASTLNLGLTALTINQGLNSEFKGSITGSGNIDVSGSITKTGPGTLVLSGQINYLGTTTVSAGTLQFARQFSLYNNKGLLSDGLTTGTWTALTLIVAPGATAAFNVGGAGEFTATDIDQLKNIGTGTGGFMNGSMLGLDTTNAAGGNFTYGGIIADPNDLVNVLGLTKLGAGTLTLTGASTYTGPTLVNAGTLSIGTTNALPSTTAVSLGIGAALDVANIQTIAGLNSTTPSSSVNLAAGKSLTVSGAGNSDYMGNIAGAGMLVKAGTGTLFIRGDAAHTGGTSLTAGILSIGDGGNTGTLAGNVSNQANLTFNRFDATTFAGIVFGAGSLTKAGAGTLTLTGPNTYAGGTTISGGTLSIGAGGTSGSITGNVVNHATLAFNRSDATTYAGVISGTGQLLKAGAGNLTLTGANTYAGNTTVSAGTLTVGVANALPSTTLLTLANGSILAVNFDQTVAGFFGASDPASLLQLAGATFTVAMPVANASTTFAGGVVGTGTFAVSGAGNDVVNLTGNVASTIATQIGAGATLVIGSGGSLSGPITTNGVLRFDNPGSQTISGVISGTGGLLATAGITTLSGANTYTGGTTVSGGKLLVTNLAGSGTGTGGVLINGGIFGGTGSISGALFVNSGGTVSPGASPGILAVGDTTFAGGGRFAFEINDTTGTPGTQWDLLSISGNLVITATPADPFVLDLVSLTAGNANGLLANFDNTGTYSWQFLSTTGSITGFSAGAFQYNASQFQNSLGSLGGHFFVSQGGNALFLNFTPVPEPSTWALLILGLGCLGLMTWRKRRV